MAVLQDDDLELEITIREVAPEPEDWIEYDVTFRLHGQPIINPELLKRDDAFRVSDWGQEEALSATISEALERNEPAYWETLESDLTLAIYPEAYFPFLESHHELVWRSPERHTEVDARDSQKAAAGGKLSDDDITVIAAIDAYDLGDVNGYSYSGGAIALHLVVRRDQLAAFAAALKAEHAALVAVAQGEPPPTAELIVKPEPEPIVDWLTTAKEGFREIIYTTADWNGYDLRNDAHFVDEVAPTIRHAMARLERVIPDMSSSQWTQFERLQELRARFKYVMVPKEDLRRKPRAAGPETDVTPQPELEAMLQTCRDAVEAIVASGDISVALLDALMATAKLGQVWDDLTTAQQQEAYALDTKLVTLHRKRIADINHANWTHQERPAEWFWLPDWPKAQGVYGDPIAVAIQAAERSMGRIQSFEQSLDNPRMIAYYNLFHTAELTRTALMRLEELRPAMKEHHLQAVRHLHRLARYYRRLLWPVAEDGIAPPNAQEHPATLEMLIRFYGAWLDEIPGGVLNRRAVTQALQLRSLIEHRRDRLTSAQRQTLASADDRLVAKHDQVGAELMQGIWEKKDDAFHWWWRLNWGPEARVERDDPIEAALGLLKDTLAEMERVATFSRGEDLLDEPRFVEELLPAARQAFDSLRQMALDLNERQGWQWRYTLERFQWYDYVMHPWLRHDRAAPDEGATSGDPGPGLAMRVRIYCVWVDQIPKGSFPNPAVFRALAMRSIIERAWDMFTAAEQAAVIASDAQLKLSHAQVGKEVWFHHWGHSKEQDHWWWHLDEDKHTSSPFLY